MEAHESDTGWHFRKLFDATPGEYQYKFRLGPGDWWACDEAKPIVADNEGNPNNSIMVTAKDTAESLSVPKPANPVNAFEGRRSDILTDVGRNTNGSPHWQKGKPESDHRSEDLHAHKDIPLFRHERLSIHDCFDAHNVDRSLLQQIQEGSESDSRDEADPPQPIRHATLRIFKEQPFPGPGTSPPSGPELATVEEHVGNSGYTRDSEDGSEEEPAPDVLRSPHDRRTQSHPQATIPTTQPTALLTKPIASTAGIQVVDLGTSKDGRHPKQSLLSSASTSTPFKSSVIADTQCQKAHFDTPYEILRHPVCW